MAIKHPEYIKKPSHEVQAVEKEYGKREVRQEVKKLANRTGVDHPGLYGGSIPPKKKIAAIVAYLLTGSSIQAEKLTGVQSANIRMWKSQRDWWPEVVSQIKADLQDDLQHRITGLMEKTLDQMDDRITFGDFQYDRKTGEYIRRPMPGKDLAATFGIIHDKRALMRGEPTKRTESSSEDRIKRLEETFRKFVEREEKTIEGTYTVNEESNGKEQ